MHLFKNSCFSKKSKSHLYDKKNKTPYEPNESLKFKVILENLKATNFSMVKKYFYYLI